MSPQDVSRVTVEWMKGFCNDPELKITLKADRGLPPIDEYRFRQSGNTFYAELDGLVHHYTHNKNDHNGFGWARYVLRMIDGFSPIESGWEDCGCNQRDWGNGSTKRADCHYDKETNAIHIIGPWHVGESQVSKLFGPIMSVSILTPEYNNKLRSPDYYRRMQRQGRAWDGTYSACSMTVLKVQEIIDICAPHLELYEGDYGWQPVVKGEQPKNPRRGRPTSSGGFYSDQQAMAIEH